MIKPDIESLNALLDGWIDRTNARPTHIYPLKTQYEDTDLGGIVYHAQYLAFAERGRSALLRCAGIDQTVMLAEGLVFVVRRIAIDYIKPARLGDCIQIHTTLAQMGRVRFTLNQRLVDSRHTPLAELTVALALITTASPPKPQPIPQSIIERILATIG